MEDSSSLQKSECAFSPGGCQTWVVLCVEGDRHWTYKFRTVQPLKSIALRCCASPEEVARVSPEKWGGEQSQQISPVYLSGVSPCLKFCVPDSRAGLLPSSLPVPMFSPLAGMAERASGG